GSISILSEDVFHFLGPNLWIPCRADAIPLGIQPFSGFIDQPISFWYQFRAAAIIAMDNRNSTGHRFNDRESTAFPSGWQHGDIACRIEITQLLARILAVKGGDDGIADTEVGR